jgi:hypothetical protein
MENREHLLQAAVYMFERTGQCFCVYLFKKMLCEKGLPNQKCMAVKELTLKKKKKKKKKIDIVFRCVPAFLH